MRKRGNLPVPDADLAPVIKKRKPREIRACRHLCPGGTFCCLDADVPHDLHICFHKECLCHSEGRYVAARARRMARLAALAA